MIEPGWKVVARDEQEVGAVETVLGDENADIFDGLVVTPGAFGSARYVPAERIAAITQGAVSIDVAHADVESLDEWNPHGDEPFPV